MNKFYFFKVALSYFDDAKTTFFITPDQSEKDEEGIPFSEDELRNTTEFKEFVKKTKADIIDVDYVGYAVEYDPKKSVVLGSPITDESFSALEKGGQLEIVDQNQFPIIVKKSSKGSRPKTGVIFAAAAAVVVVLMAAAIGVYKGGFFGITAPGAESTGTLDASGSSESESSSDSAESGTSDAESSVNSENSNESSGDTHEPSPDTSDNSPGNSDTSGDDSSDNSDNSDISGNSEVSGKIEESAIFNLSDWANMAVAVSFDVEEPEVTFIDPHGIEIPSSEFTKDRTDKSVCFYVESADAGQWHIRCDKKGNTELDVRWAEYTTLPEIN